MVCCASDNESASQKTRLFSGKLKGGLEPMLILSTKHSHDGSKYVAPVVVPITETAVPGRWPVQLEQQ